MTEQLIDVTAEAKRLIDEALTEIANVNFVEAPKMTDLLLDIRLALGADNESQG